MYDALWMFISQYLFIFLFCKEQMFDNVQLHLTGAFERISVCTYYFNNLQYNIIITQSRTWDNKALEYAVIVDETT